MPASPASFSFTRKFGVELEVVGSSTLITETLQNAGIDVHYAGYSHSVSQNWKVVSDGSVSGGNEIVSPILQGEDGLAQVRKVCNALTAAGITVNRSCGYHVHFDMTGVSTQDVAKIVKRWIRDEAYIDLILPESRRGTSNYYCQPLRRASTTIEDQWRTIDRCDRISDSSHSNTTSICNAVCGGNRYYKLNLMSHERYRTIEFRHHSGTCDAEKAVNWIIFLDCLCKSAVSKSYTRKWNSNQDTFPVAKKVHYLMLVAGVPNKVRNYYIKRAVELAAPATPSRRRRAA